MQEYSRAFRAMNTDVLAVIATEVSRRAEAEAALEEVQSLFALNEGVMSRFLPDSELSRLNRSAGGAFRASPLLFQVVARAMEAARATNGVFDPTVLGALVSAGYDRSFELLARDPAPRSDPDVAARIERVTRGDSLPRPTWREVRLEAATKSVSLPPTVGLDLGGIGKGWTVDRAADRLRSFPNFAVDAGGDLYVGGTQADGSPWTVGLEDPLRVGADLAVLALSDRAVATSTVSRRRWVKDGREQHHLIDPRTGLAAKSGVLSATVVAESVARAEVLAKVALLLGPEAGAALLRRERGVEWVLVQGGGRVEASAGLPEVQHAF